MPRLARRALASAACAAALACAHAPARPESLPAVAWPEPPSAARVRLAAVFPGEADGEPARPWWRRLIERVAGVDRDERRRTWLVRPFGVAATASAFYVADPDGASVVRVDAAGPARVRCRGRAWRAPMAVATGADGTLLVADAAAAEIVIVSPDGTCRAVGAGALERPTAVALDGGRVVVADPPQHAVVIVPLDGGPVERWGSLGEGENELHFPTAVARAPDGSFLVVDALNFRIVRFASDGRWLGQFGSPGDVGDAFARPKGIAVDADGRIYVSDAQRDLVLVFDARGALEYTLGAAGEEPGRLTLPAGVAVAAGKLYVADSHNHRVQVFEIVGGRS